MPIPTPVTAVPRALGRYQLRVAGLLGCHCCDDVTGLVCAIQDAGPHAGAEVVLLFDGATIKEDGRLVAAGLPPAIALDSLLDAPFSATVYAHVKRTGPPVLAVDPHSISIKETAQWN
jgi:hypothetical protein